ncbi:MAG TPA: nitroreductase/quinone reductase family protein [Mycobacterium sp.]|nr:nitroreductase/quinone reductase family protein [Mycobacterium sp.]
MASAAGAPKNPAWYYNIAANPDNVWIETTDGKVAVAASQLQGAERDEAWNQIASA